MVSNQREKTKITKLKNLFKTEFPVIGVLHLPALPGSYNWGQNWDEIIENTIKRARILVEGGVNSIIIENYGDIPFVKDKVDPVTVSAMSVLGIEVKKVVPDTMPLGINVLRNDGFSATAIATIIGAKFIRLNILCGAMITDQGLIEGKAHDLMLYQKTLGIKMPILADVMVKHAVPLSSQDICSIAEDTAYRAGAFGLIVSGQATGKEVVIDDLKKVHETMPNYPVFIGSGASIRNIHQLVPYCDGIIVASSLKTNEEYDVLKIKEFTNIAKTLFK